MDRVTVTMTLEFGRYIAHPYWPERNDVIDIQKKSGMNRAQSDAKREAALKGYLEKQGLTMADYETLVRKADRQWYRVDNDAPKSEIVIPRHQVAGAIVQALLTAPSAIRGKYKPETARSYLDISDLRTGKTKADGTFDRYVKLEGSNQRSRQKNEYIDSFTAAGTIGVERPFAAKDLLGLKHLLVYVFREIGVGASRKMGYGRAVVKSVALEGEPDTE